MDCLFFLWGGALSFCSNQLWVIVKSCQMSLFLSKSWHCIHSSPALFTYFGFCAMTKTSQAWATSQSFSSTCSFLWQTLPCRLSRWPLGWTCQELFSGLPLPFYSYSYSALFELTYCFTGTQLCYHSSGLGCWTWRRLFSSCFTTSLFSSLLVTRCHQEKGVIRKILKLPSRSAPVPAWSGCWPSSPPCL